MERSRSFQSISSRGSSSIREIEEESVINEEQNGEEEEFERVYVAVKKEVKEGKSTLLWLLHNTDKERKKIVITHVHIPSHMIPMMGSKFPAHKVKQQVVKEYRQHEREKMHKCLDDYMTVCSELKVRAEKLVIEADDPAKGLIELVALRGIAKLIMGAAADKHFSRRMKVPKSKTAITVQKKADPLCRIWFVCKGNLISTREALLDTSVGTPSLASTRSSLSISTQSLPESLSFGSDPVNDFSRHRSRSDNFDSHGGGTTAAIPLTSPQSASVPRSRFSSDVSLTADPWDGISRSFQRSDHSFCSVADEVQSNMSSFPFSVPNDGGSEEGSVLRPLVQESDEDLHFSSPQNVLEDGLDAEVYERLREAHVEVENSKHEAYKESLKRQKAERDAIDALRKAKTYENLCAKEMNRRKDIEEALARERMEVEKLKIQLDEIFEQLQMANKEKLELELRIADSDGMVRDLDEKLLSARHLLNSLQVQHDELQLQRDAMLKEVEELRQNKELVTTSSNGSTNFSEFSFTEIELATCNFSDSLKIGEGGYGSVYRGFLRNTPVAIKVLNPQSMQGQSEFHQEVDVLSRVRHPNLVTLIGVCSEARALIYEFLPNGSLEDRLACKDNTSPLSWQVRTRIAAEICSSLIFLHSSKPHPVVHGDLKPENILLDANLGSKLGDFGICRLLVQTATYTTTFYRHTHPKGTFVYMDPEFLATGELTPRSDVYSFGVIILRLLTGKPAFGIVKEVKEALDKGSLHGMIDPTTGDWPFVQAKQLAHLGLRCCEISRKNRPDLVGEVWRVLEPMLKTTSLSMSSLSFGSVMEENIPIPNYFICPIFQEIMRDPQVAADGFTYEAEALKGWIESGHSTSPMTNLALRNCELIPNRALRSAIQEWLQHHPQL